MVLFGVEIRSHLQANCPVNEEMETLLFKFFCLNFNSMFVFYVCNDRKSVFQFRIKSCFQRFRITVSDYQQQQQQQAVSRRNSSSSSSTQSKPSLAAPPTQAPTARPPTPPSTYGGGTGGGGTLRKASSSPYRTPAPPVSPPVAPSNYAPNYPIQAPSPSSSMSSLRKTGYATGNMASVGQPQPTAQIMRSVSGVSVQSQVYDHDSTQPYISGYWI